MCSKKGTPMAKRAWPVPSRLIETLMRVSRVLRSTDALRSTITSSAIKIRGRKGGHYRPERPRLEAARRAGRFTPITCSAFTDNCRAYNVTHHLSHAWANIPPQCVHKAVALDTVFRRQAQGLYDSRIENRNHARLRRKPQPRLTPGPPRPGTHLCRCARVVAGALSPGQHLDRRRPGEPVPAGRPL